MSDALILFRQTLNADTPPEDFSVFLQALWHDKRGNWNTAHGLIDHLSGTKAARIHAYLHRREGDISNAGYWYRQAGTAIPDLSLDKEWEFLVNQFMTV